MDFKVFIGEKSIFFHFCQYHIAAFFTSLGRGTRIVVFVGFERAHQGSSLVEGEIFGVFVEKSMSSRLYAVSIIAKRYRVEVEGDNFLFSIDFLNAAGDNHFFDFMHRHREFSVALATPENVFSQLHREGTPPARRIVLQEQCFEKYPKEASHIHATVVVKTFVLGSDERIYQVRRKIGIFDFCAVEDIEFT